MPSAFVESVVMVRAHRDEVLEVGGSSVLGPFEDVVDLAPVERCVTGVDHTRAVHGAQRGALCGGGEAAGASDVEGLAVTGEDDRDDVRVARVSADRGDRDR